jgi:uncharacterized protein (DUF4415 family)
MKKGKDTENFNEKMKAEGWREIDRSKAPRPKQRKISGDVKSRITIYLDADIVSYYKEMAEDSGSGYQTLINQSLREIVDGHGIIENSDKAAEAFNKALKIRLLQDKNFLQELKEALALEF